MEIVRGKLMKKLAAEDDIEPGLMVAYLLMQTLPRLAFDLRRCIELLESRTALMAFGSNRRR
jgi:hypothetical protein